MTRTLRRTGLTQDLAFGLPMLAFIALPIGALVLHAPGSVRSALGSPESKDAIEVSLRSTAGSLLLILALGTPLAIFLSRPRFFGKWLFEALVEAPLVLPPAAAGIGLLLAFGRNGLVRTELPFSFGAVVLAQAFVAAPLFIRSLSAALEAIDPQWADAAALDGATRRQIDLFVRLPLVAGAFVTGAVIAWARSLGEFGATILFAGNLAGKTQTMPLAIYLGLESDLDQAIGLSVVLLGFAFLVLMAIRGLESIRLRPVD